MSPVAEALDLDVLARVGTALADASRRRILVALLKGPAYPSDLAETLAMTRSNMSNHLTCLRGCGLVVAVSEGRRQRYELADERLGDVLMTLCRLPLPAPASCVHDGSGR